MRRNQGGYSPGEFMATVLIIGVLAIITITTQAYRRGQNMDNFTRMNVSRVRLAMEAWGHDHGGCYPRNYAELQTKLPAKFANPWGDPKSVYFVSEPANFKTDLLERGVVLVAVHPEPSGNVYRYNLYGGDHNGKPIKTLMMAGR